MIDYVACDECGLRWDPDSIRPWFELSRRGATTDTEWAELHFCSVECLVSHFTPEDVPLERPMLDEAAAVFTAVDAFGRKLRPGSVPVTKDFVRQLDELSGSIARVRAVTRDDDPPPEGGETAR